MTIITRAIMMFLVGLFLINPALAQEHPRKDNDHGKKMEAGTEELNESNRQYSIAFNKFREELALEFASPGKTVAVLGAGMGELTAMMGERVTEAGRVYANEIHRDLLQKINERCAKQGLKNVTAILGEIEDPLLPENIIDTAIMVEVYHHLDKPEAFLKAIHEDLKVGSRLVIVEPDANQPGGDINGCYADPERTREMTVNAGFIFESIKFIDVHKLKFFVLVMEKS